jgi:hypothetical protein
VTVGEPLHLRLGSHDEASLDGTWQFFPGSHELADLDTLDSIPIEVPGLWEAQGHLELDGDAWYRRLVVLGDVADHWTLHFGAVMDLAEVFVNGQHAGSHQQPFTPFALDVTAALREGENSIAVRVTDPPLDDPRHIRMAHGKQGWANHVFPSRPSLYMTYGGIWQSVRLRRHGRVVISDVFVNGDPDDLRAVVEVANLADTETWAVVGVRGVGAVSEHVVRLAAGGSEVLSSSLGAVGAARWSPERPALHDLLVDAKVEEALSDRRRVRFGLRTVRVDGSRLLLNGQPYRMRSALVQGFRAEQLYAEGTREEIRAEVHAAKRMGFNTLRLHIKAFDPAYLDVCDEEGMLVHSDLPVAEPIAHEELGDGSIVSDRCVEAVRQQIRRDRNHPSIVLWSAMNELGLDREGVRGWDAYEQFARTLYAAAVDADPTRPVIENDWVEPDPDRVFCSPILTAHWYGRLHAEYLEKLEQACRSWAGVERPLFVTEFGDWGLPAMPELEGPPFWDPRDVYAAGLAASLWPATIGRFVRETQRYQGISDRLQIEVFRRHDHIGGYCLTELTDVPHELNGLLDLHRAPKPFAVSEVTRGNQIVLPMLHLDSLVVERGAECRAPLHVANDGAELRDVEIGIRFGGAMTVPLERLAGFDDRSLSAAEVAARFTESVTAVRLPLVPAHSVTAGGEVTLRVPDVTGSHDLLVDLIADGRQVAANRYPVHVVEVRPASYPVQQLACAELLEQVGAEVGQRGPLVIGEDALDARSGATAASLLAAGGTVLVLAQPPAAAPHYPRPVEIAAIETAWGSSVFHFTTDSGAVPSLPRRNLLVAEESTIQARAAIVRIGESGFPDEPVVIAYKPVPGSITGWVVGAHRVGAGRLICCQYRLAAPALRGDTAARALLADLVRWAADPPAEMRRDTHAKPDGRALAYYARAEAAR